MSNVHAKQPSRHYWELQPVPSNRGRNLQPEPADSEAQTAIQPTAKILNNDAEFQ